MRLADSAHTQADSSDLRRLASRAQHSLARQHLHRPRARTIDRGVKSVAINNLEGGRVDLVLTEAAVEAGERRERRCDPCDRVRVGGVDRGRILLVEDRNLEA